MEKNSRQHKHPVSPPCHYSAHALPHLPPAEPSYSEGRNSKHWAQGFHTAVSWMGLKTVRSNSFSCVLVEKSTLWHFSKGIYHHSVMVNTSQELFCTLIYFVARVFKLLSNSDLQPKLPVKTNVNLSCAEKGRIAALHSSLLKLLPVMPSISRCVIVVRWCAIVGLKRCRYAVILSKWVTKTCGNYWRFASVCLMTASLMLFQTKRLKKKPSYLCENLLGFQTIWAMKCKRISHPIRSCLVLRLK